MRNNRGSINAWSSNLCRVFRPWEICAVQTVNANTHKHSQTRLLCSKTKKRITQQPTFAWNEIPKQDCVGSKACLQNVLATLMFSCSWIHSGLRAKKMPRARKQQTQNMKNTKTSFTFMNNAQQITNIKNSCTCIKSMHNINNIIKNKNWTSLVFIKTQINTYSTVHLFCFSLTLLTLKYSNY